ncbi:unnamed protein product [Rotaria socialis]|uniref:Uncharacterized protein n=1 Tax=Rotaria socialis TaxID=392032 RepID=A0A817XPM7_9BILA|nr:unnamed protein product [Rotaria socialis]CAF4644995.1 unnamed protein product [Rotaria socialis]
MFVTSNTDTLKCPITFELFRDPVTGQDGHTYERDAIITWLQKNGASPQTREPMTIDSLRPNHIVKQLVDEFKSSSLQKHFLFRFGIDIRKAGKRPIFQTQGKSIYRAEWISKPGPDVVLLKIEGAKANREAGYYVQLGSHPHIVHTYGMVENDFNALMLVQEYATEGDLAELLKENEFQPSKLVLLEIFLQIIDAMVYLANYGIVHGDLACRNVLVFRLHNSNPQENLVKLTDFGLTRASTLYSVVGSTTSTTLAVVPLRYAAPEILLSAGLSNYSEKSDVYSMGILMWEACSQGQLPYGSIEDDSEVCRFKIKGGILSQPENCDEKLWNIMVQCWHQQSGARSTFKMLKESLCELSVQSAAFHLKNVKNKSIKNKMPTIVHNTTDSHVQRKADTRIDSPMSNENPLMKTTIICNFCNSYLPGLGKFIHDQTFRMLNLNGKQIDDEALQHVASILADHKTLIEFNLSNNHIGHKGARHLARALRNNQTLTKLNLLNNSIGDIGAQYLAEAIHTNKEQNKLNDLLMRVKPWDARILPETLRTNQTLTTLNLSSNYIGPSGVMHLAGALGINQTLTTLKLKKNHIGDTGLQYLAEALRSNQTLTTLGLSRNTIGNAGVQYLAAALEKNQALKNLSISYNDIEDAGVQYLAEALQGNQTLTRLNLRENHICHRGAQNLAEALQNNRALDTLQLETNQIGDKGVQHFAEALRTNRVLKLLDLSCNNIGVAGAQYLARALENNKILAKLSLRNNLIGDLGLQYLAEGLHNNRSLITLELNSNNIGGSGLKYLAEALLNNQALTTLDLSENRICDEGVQYLADALRNNQKLITLDLRKNSIGPSGVQYLAEALRNNQTLTTAELDWNQRGHPGVQYLAEVLRNNQTLKALLHEDSSI